MTHQENIQRHDKRLIYVSNIETYTVEKAIQKAVLLIQIARIIYGLEMIKGRKGIGINWFGYEMAVPNSNEPLEDGKRVALLGKQLNKINQA